MSIFSLRLVELCVPVLLCVVLWHVVNSVCACCLPLWIQTYGGGRVDGNFDVETVKE